MEKMAKYAGMRLAQGNGHTALRMAEPMQREIG
jgi:hypothetical protein